MNSFVFLNVHANTVDVFIPQIWARESLLVLEEQLIAASLVHRDFEPLISSYGDVVNTRLPGTLKAVRKVDCEDITIQDVSASSLQVKLDQHIHTSFLICDGQESKSFADLIEEYLRPALTAQARIIDNIVLGQYVHFLKHATGKAFAIDSTNGKDYIVDVREIQNKLKMPMEGRYMVLNTTTESDLLRLDLFSRFDVSGDAVTQRTGQLGPKFGYNFFMSQNMPEVPMFNGTARLAGAINLAAGYAAGATVLAVDGITGAAVTGAWVMIDGLPYRITAHSETTGNTTSITLGWGLYRAVVDNAPIYIFVPAAVNFVGGYPVGYAKEIVIDTVVQAPVVGQGVSFGTSGTSVLYTVIDLTGTTGITLDRPLEAAISNDDAVHFGPAGNFNMAFHKNAIALVVRPLALPKQGTGVLSAVVNRNDLSVRVVISYDARKQGHLVTVDFLCGIKVLNEDLGAVLVG